MIDVPAGQGVSPLSLSPFPIHEVSPDMKLIRARGRVLVGPGNFCFVYYKKGRAI